MTALLRIGIGFAGLAVGVLFGACRTTQLPMDAQAKPDGPWLIEPSARKVPDEIPRAEEVSAREMSEVRVVLLASDLALRGKNFRLRLFGREWGIVVDSVVRRGDGAFYAGHLVDGEGTIGFYSGPDGFSGFIELPDEGNVEISGCEDGTCVATLFRKAQPLFCSTTAIADEERGRSKAATIAPRSDAATPEIVDILVLYTTSSQKKWPYWQKVNSQLVDAQALIGWTNLAFACSNVRTRLHLTGVEVVEFEESGSFADDLKRWVDAGTPDGQRLAKLRKAHGADLVSVIAGLGDKNHGSAYTYDGSSDFADRAVSVSRWDVKFGLHVFAHEVGHNMGGGHQGKTRTGYDDVAHGHLFTSSYYQFATVMWAGARDRTGHFSNPDVCHAQKPTGTATANNASTLNATAKKIADLRPGQTSIEEYPACTHSTRCP